MLQSQNGTGFVRASWGAMPVRVAKAKADRAAAFCRVEFARARERLRAMEVAADARGVDLTVQQRALVEGVLETCSRIVRGERPDHTLADLAALTQSHRELGSLSDVATQNPDLIPSLQDPERRLLSGFLAACGGDPSLAGDLDGIIGPLANVAASTQAPIRQATSTRVPTFSDAATEYETHRRDAGTREKELGALRRHAAAFVALLGDRPLDTYVRRDVEDFAAGLSFLPLRHGSIPTLQGASLEAVMDLRRALRRV